MFLGKWDDMEVYVNMIPRDTYDSSFYRSVIAIRTNEFQKAQEVINFVLKLRFLTVDLFGFV